MISPNKPRVMVTRSVPEGQRLVRAIKGRGCDVIYCPAAVLVGAENTGDLRCAILDRPKPEGVIVTSPSGLVEAVKLLGAPWFNQQPLVVPGEFTAQRAKALGVVTAVSPPGSGDSEAMLALSQLSQVAGQRWLILAADGGRRLLEQALSGRGARVERHHVYRRLPAPLPAQATGAFQQHAPLIVLLASAGALAWMQNMVDDETWSYLARQTFIAPSKRVAVKARQAGCATILQASGADDAAMIDALDKVLCQDGFR